MGPISVSAFRGSSLLTVSSTWLTCDRAQYMSASSSKTSVMTDSPLRDMLRRSSSLGMLARAISTGVVMYCSTSCAPSDGACVMTCTWLLVMSGVASNGRRTSDHTPHTMSASVRTPTTSLLWMEYVMSF